MPLTDSQFLALLGKQDIFTIRLVRGMGDLQNLTWLRLVKSLAQELPSAFPSRCREAIEELSEKGSVAWLSSGQLPATEVRSMASC